MFKRDLYQFLAMQVVVNDPSVCLLSVIGNVGDFKNDWGFSLGASATRLVHCQVFVWGQEDISDFEMIWICNFICEIMILALFQEK